MDLDIIDNCRNNIMILLFAILNIQCIRQYKNIIKDSLISTMMHFKSRHHIQETSIDGCGLVFSYLADVGSCDPSRGNLLESPFDCIT